MIRNMIHGNDYNSDRSSLAYVHVHVRILPGNTHAHPQALKPINKPSYLHTWYLKHTVAACTTWGPGCFTHLCHTKEQLLTEVQKHWSNTGTRSSITNKHDLLCFSTWEFNCINLLYFIQKLNRKLWQKLKSRFHRALNYENKLPAKPWGGLQWLCWEIWFCPAIWI